MQDERRARVAWIANSILPHEKEVRGWLRRSLSSHADIDDVIQESYCRLWSAASPEAVAAPRAYFYQTVRSVLIDRRRRERVVGIETAVEIEAMALGGEHSPERITAGRLELERLKAILATLPERARRILEMRKVLGLSQKDIAAALGVSENVVENDAARALRQVLKAYQQDGAEAGHGAPSAPKPRSLLRRRRQP